METQHAHPDVMIAAFADDEYALGPVPRALSAHTATRTSALRLCGLQSVPSKSSLYLPEADSLYSAC
eukprot:6192011-Pleurochrysis_carterae.AAC.2